MDAPTGQTSATEAVEGGASHHPTVRQGWTVYGADGKNLGTIVAIYANEMVVHKGGLFGKKDMTVPRAAVARVEKPRGKVYLGAATQ